MHSHGGDDVYSDWTTKFFGGLAVEFWVRVAPEPSETEIDFLEEVFGARHDPGSQRAAGGPAGEPPALLDIACGSGRYTIPLAARGYRMTGIDISNDFIDVARQRDANVDWHRGDIRELPWSDQFDGALCFGNSFGYFPRVETREFLRGVARALKPGAPFVLETSATAESLLPTLQRERRIEAGGIVFSSINRYDAMESRLDIDYTIESNGLLEMKAATTFLFTTGEVAQMFVDAGFELEGLYASSARDEFAVGSPRAIFVGHRIPSPTT